MNSISEYDDSDELALMGFWRSTGAILGLSVVEPEQKPWCPVLQGSGDQGYEDEGDNDHMTSVPQNLPPVKGYM